MQMRWTRWAGLGVLLWSFVQSGPAHASLVEALDLATLVADADQVVVGRVVSQTSHYDKRGQIVTDTALQVEETLKGDQAPGAAILVRRLGGEVDGIGMRVAGEASFTTGESVLVFGARLKTGEAWRTVGMAQGAIRISERDGVRWAHSAAGGLSAVRRAGGQLKSARLAVPEPRRLDELLEEIRTLAGAQR